MRRQRPGVGLLLRVDFRMSYMVTEQIQYLVRLYQSRGPSLVARGGKPTADVWTGFMVPAVLQFVNGWEYLSSYFTPTRIKLPCYQ